jgi:hypothetical protein
MAHGLYNSRPIYDLNEEQERAYWQDFITHLEEMTGKRTPPANLWHRFAIVGPGRHCRP